MAFQDPNSPAFSGLTPGTGSFLTGELTQDGSKLVNQEVTLLEPHALVELYILDATPIGGEIFYFHAGTNKLASPITYQGIGYYPMPVEVKGFEFKTKGQLPRPTITFSNVGGFMKNLILLYDDLVGALVIRRRVYAQFLDGQPNARTDNHLPDDVFSISQKTAEDRYRAVFELGTAFEVEGVQLPRRQVISSLCQFMYRGDGCFFAQRRVINGVDAKALVPSLAYTGIWNSLFHYEVGMTTTAYYPSNTPNPTGEKIYMCHSANGGVDPNGSNGPGTPWLLQQFIVYNLDSSGNPLQGDFTYKSANAYAQYQIVSRFGLRHPNVPLLFIALSPVPPGFAPPNSVYWGADQCPKDPKNGCIPRFDPLNLRLPLPFGGYPGTVKIPDSVG